MHPYLRIVLVCFAILLFFVLFCIVWLDSVLIQGIGFTFTLALAIILFKPKRMWKLFLSFFPFFIMLTAIYLLLGVWGLGQSKEYWFHYGLTRTILLANSLLIMQIALRFVNVDALLDLPLNIHTMKYFILGKHLFEAASKTYSELCVYSEFMPLNQIQTPSFQKRLKIKLVQILALVSFVISEATLKGEMIDERIRHCWPER